MSDTQAPTTRKEHFCPQSFPAQDIFEMSQALNTLMETKDGDEIVLLPGKEGWKVETINHNRRRPYTIDEQITFENVKDFARYVTRFSDEPLVMRDEDSMEAVLDYHTPSRPGTPATPNHAIHRVRMAPELSSEWKLWNAQSEAVLTQVQFANFIEDNMCDIISPDGAELLEVINTIQATKTANFASGIKLHDGTHQLTYVEDSKASAGKSGNLSIPSEIKIRIPFYTSDPALKVEIKARFRYRIQDGRLTFTYILHRPKKALADAFSSLVEEFEKMTSIAPLYGRLDT